MSYPTTPTVVLKPSANNPGTYNVLNGSGQHMSVDPNKGVNWNDNDGNYEQFTFKNNALWIQPGGDNDPTLPWFVYLPT